MQIVNILRDHHPFGVMPRALTIRSRALTPASPPGRVVLRYARQASGAGSSSTGEHPRELKRKDVALSTLWDEYITRNPEVYRYSRFCELYCIGKMSSVTNAPDPRCAGPKRQDIRRLHRLHHAGDSRSADGEVRQPQIFDAVLGAPTFTCIEARWTQRPGRDGRAYGDRAAPIRLRLLRAVIYELFTVIMHVIEHADVVPSCKACR
jgi:hypothetical protein